MNSLRPQEYADKYLQVLQDYINDVTNGSRLVGKLERLAVTRYVAFLDKYEYRKEELIKALKFISLLNIVHRNEVLQFALAPYQVFALSQIYCFYYPGTDKRVTNTVLLSISSKNGKSNFILALAILEAILDGEKNASITVISPTTKQSGEILKYAKTIIENSPAIDGLFKIKHSTIENKQKGSINSIFVMSDNPKNVQGLSISLSVIDEIFCFDQRTLSVKDITKSKQAARKNPLQILIGTVKEKDSITYEEVYKPAVNVLEGLVEDDTFCILMFQQDSKEEIEQPETWIKSNAALGYTIDLDYLLQEFKSSKIFPSKFANFQQEHLNFNLETIAEETFLTDELVNRCMKDSEPIEPGSEIIIGVDLSSNTDINSIAIMQEKNGIFRFNVINIIPNVQKNFIKGDVDLTRWFVKDLQVYKDNYYQPDEVVNPKGYIIPSTAPVLDTELIEDIITDLSNKYKIKAVCYDNYNSAQVIHKLINKGIYCLPVGQTILVQNEPIKFCERLILADKNLFQIQRNPFVKWQARNLLLYRNLNNDVKFIKRTRKGEPLSIDSWSAMLNCMVYWWDMNKDNLSGISFKLDNMNW